jgi:hypothetical protein
MEDLKGHAVAYINSDGNGRGYLNMNGSHSLEAFINAVARDIQDRRSIIWGKHVTGHCLEYDYKDGTGFMGTDFNMGPPPYPLEYILRDATGPEGGYHGNFGKETSVIVDYPFITGRSTPDSYLTGQQLVEVLGNNLTRYGW